MPDTADPNKLEGIYGLGFSNNEYLDLMNLVALAAFGIIITMFFKENYTKLGNVGPASTNIWGLGLTATALFLLLFMTIYLTSCTQDSKNCFIENKITISSIFSHELLPILLTLLIVIYIIAINFMYFVRINSNNVTSSYHTYSLFSIFLLIIQISLIIKYIYNLLSALNHEEKDRKKYKDLNFKLQGISYILISINFIFVLIIHILLAFFSTDG